MNAKASLVYEQRLDGKNVVVVGGSRGLGRTIIEEAFAQGANVLAVARGKLPLEKLAADLPGAQTLAADVTDENSPDRVFAALDPDVVVLCAGAIPPTIPLQDQNWRQFSTNWKADVKGSFLFCRAALHRPLKTGAVTILISSGAAIGGSPISGGYACQTNADVPCSIQRKSPIVWGSD